MQRLSVNLRFPPAASPVHSSLALHGCDTRHSALLLGSLIFVFTLESNSCHELHPVFLQEHPHYSDSKLESRSQPLSGGYWVILILNCIFQCISDQVNTIFHPSWKQAEPSRIIVCFLGWTHLLAFCVVTTKVENVMCCITFIDFP